MTQIYQISAVDLMEFAKILSLLIFVTAFVAVICHSFFVALWDKLLFYPYCDIQSHKYFRLQRIIDRKVKRQLILNQKMA